MSFKIPVVAPELNVIPEVVKDNITGFVYPLNNSSFASEKILKLADDCDLREKMGNEGFKRIQSQYSLNTFMAEMKDILRKTIK